MPAAPGESLLTTLFADVHYYFSDPASKPQHHRFDRGSYVYLYHNVNNHQAKFEIANHAGTPDQDAFSGFLNSASVDSSYKHPTLCTLRVDAYIQDQGQWHLPSYDERNERKYLYKLHSLDLYLWTEKDAATLLAHLKAVMPASRLEIKDAPSSAVPTPSASRMQSLAEHRDSMSPVVQQLEQTAIGAHFPPRAESTVSAVSLPGPPTPATTAGASPPQQPVSPPQAAPLAYNPAAPPAPEPIAYREKTPPPPDDGRGTGLSGAGQYDAMPQYASVPQGYHQNSNQHTPQQAYFGGPPQQVQPPTPGFPGPPQGTLPAHVPRTYSGNLPPPPSGKPSPQPYTPSFGPPPTLDTNLQPTSPPPHQQSFNRQSSFGGPPGQTQFASYVPQQTQYAQHPGSASFGPTAMASPGFGPPGTPGYQSMQQPPTPSAPPAYSGHTPLSSPGLPPPPSTQPPSQHQQQQQQVHSYSNYSYNAAQAAPPINQQGAYTGDLHGQVYRPTEAEAAHGHGGHGHQAATAARPQSAARQPSDGRQRLEERVTGVEKRVGGFLKRLDKLI